jgi:DNA-binding PucR family transcriptional regulator
MSTSEPARSPREPREDPGREADAAARAGAFAPDGVDGAPGTLLGRLREVHLEMVDAVLGGEGLPRVAELAARAARAPVAIVVPQLGAATGAPAGSRAQTRLDALERYVADRAAGRPASVPAACVAEVPIGSAGDAVGSVLMLDGGEAASPEAAEFLHLAAVAALTEVAVEEAKDEVEHNLRASLMEELVGEAEVEVDDLLRRAGRLGCDLRHGAVALCAEVSSERPRHLAAMVADECPGAMVEQLGGRVYALVPASATDAAGDAALAMARRLTRRLARQGAVGMSSFHPDPADIARALEEAELVLGVLRHADADGAPDVASATYRLLFRVLASHPEEVRSFYADTVAPLVRYDDQYSTDLVGTLEAYLAHNGNMNATAAAIYAHRHTVAYRLERVRELTGLDASQSEDRERLSLGLKAYRIIAHRLPR